MVKQQSFYMSVFLTAVLLPLPVYGIGIGSILNETYSSWNWGPEYQPYGREPVTFKLEAHGEGFDQIAPKFPYYHTGYPDGGSLDSVLIAYSDQDVNYTEADNPVFDYPGGSVYFTFLIQPSEGYVWPNETFLLTAGAISVSQGQNNVAIGVHYKYYNDYKYYPVGIPVEDTTDSSDSFISPPWKIFGKHHGPLYNGNTGLWVKAGDIIQFDSHDNQIDGNGLDGYIEKRYLVDVPYLALVGGVQPQEGMSTLFQSANNPDGFIGGGLRTVIAPITGFLSFGINQNSASSGSWYGEFTVTATVIPKITLTNPDRFTFIDANSLYQITWDASGYLDDIKIDYSIDSGQSWTEIDPNVIKNQDVYDWNTPDMISENGILRLSHSDTNTVEVMQFAIGNSWPSYFLTIQSAPAQGGSIIPVPGVYEVDERVPVDISTEPNEKYAFINWSAAPNENAVIDDPNITATRVSLLGDTIITANFAPLGDLTIQPNPTEGGTTTPSEGTITVFLNIPVDIQAEPAPGCTFLNWSAVPPGNVVFGDVNESVTTVILYGDANVMANFNLPPLAQAVAIPSEIYMPDSNSATLDASYSSDDGLIAPLTFYWEQTSGPDTCTILNPDSAVADIIFTEPQLYEFRLTVSDGQLQDTELISLRVSTPQSDIVYVSPEGNDDIAYGTLLYPYATIQRGIDQVKDGGEVIVRDGEYTGPGNRSISFRGKDIVVHSENGRENCIINCQSQGKGFSLTEGTTLEAIIDGFTIIDATTAVYCHGGSVTVENCTIVSCSTLAIFAYCPNLMVKNCIIRDGNSDAIYFEPNCHATIQGCKIIDNLGHAIHSQWCWLTITNNVIANNSYGLLLEAYRSSTIRNNTIVDNFLGIYLRNASVGISNCIVRGNELDQIMFVYMNEPSVQYSNIQGGYSGIGNIDTDPCFTDPNQRDYHLNSEAGRWDPNLSEWVYDYVTSPCIDAGHPDSDWTEELWPHGKRINMGAYGGTVQASMSLSDTGNIANLDNDVDDRIDYNDLEKFIIDWCRHGILIRSDFNVDKIVNFADFAVFAENWMTDNLILSTGLAHYYSYEENTNTGGLIDIIAGKNSSLMWGEPLVESNGVTNYGWAFDGNDAIAWDDTLLPDLEEGDNFTLSMWGYNTGLTNNNDGIWSTYHTNGTDSYFLVDIYDGWLRFIGANMGLDDNYEAYIVPILPDKWYHYVWRKNGSEYTIFVNGVEVFSTTGNDAITWDKNVKRHFMIGSQSSVDPGDYWWNGYFDEFGVWLRSLSDQEISRLYNDGEGLSYSDIIGTE